MKCDRSAECGLYGQLVQMKIVEAGKPCGKPDPLKCPRHQVANGINIEKAQEVFGVKNILETELPITYEETLLMFPDGA